LNCFQKLTTRCSFYNMMKTRLARVAKRKETHLLGSSECTDNCSKTDTKRANQNATVVVQYWALTIRHINYHYTTNTAMTLREHIIIYNIFNCLLLQLLSSQLIYIYILFLLIIIVLIFYSNSKKIFHI